MCQKVLGRSALSAKSIDNDIVSIIDFKDFIVLKEMVRQGAMNILMLLNFKTILRLTKKIKPKVIKQCLEQAQSQYSKDAVHYLTNRTEMFL